MVKFLIPCLYPARTRIMKKKNIFSAWQRRHPFVLKQTDNGKGKYVYSSIIQCPSYAPEIISLKPSRVSNLCMKL